MVGYRVECLRAATGPYGQGTASPSTASPLGQQQQYGQQQGYGQQQPVSPTTASSPSTASRSARLRPAASYGQPRSARLRPAASVGQQALRPAAGSPAGYGQQGYGQPATASSRSQPVRPAAAATARLRPAAAVAARLRPAAPYGQQPQSQPGTASSRSLSRVMASRATASSRCPTTTRLTTASSRVRPATVSRATVSSPPPGLRPGLRPAGPLAGLRQPGYGQPQFQQATASRRSRSPTTATARLPAGYDQQQYAQGYGQPQQAPYGAAPVRPAPYGQPGYGPAVGVRPPGPLRPLAEWWQRLVARILDGVCSASSTSWSRSSLVGVLAGELQLGHRHHLGLHQPGCRRSSSRASCSPALFVGYDFLMHKLRGQTLGKMVMGIKVVQVGRTDGGRASPDAAIKRAGVTWGAYVLYWIPVVGPLHHRCHLWCERAFPAVGQAAAADVRRQVRQDCRGEDQVVTRVQSETHRRPASCRPLCFVRTDVPEWGDPRHRRREVGVMARTPPPGPSRGMVGTPGRPTH